jgi:hypothetical protein
MPVIVAMPVSSQKRDRIAFTINTTPYFSTEAFPHSTAALVERESYD